jgi:hypothetical protein
MDDDRLKIVPITLATAKEFIKSKHRHNKPPVGWKFGIGLRKGDNMIGVATAGRPISRYLDDGLTLEINRTCTDGTKNANSMLYSAIWRVGKAMGYKRCITYTRQDESGISLRAAGWLKVKELPPHKNWNESSVKLKHKRDPNEESGVRRIIWEIRIKE